MPCLKDHDDEPRLLQALAIDAELAQRPDKHDRYRERMVEVIQWELGWSDDDAYAHADKIIGDVAEMNSNARQYLRQSLASR